MARDRVPPVWARPLLLTASVTTVASFLAMLVISSWFGRTEVPQVLAAACLAVAVLASLVASVGLTRWGQDWTQRVGILGLVCSVVLLVFAVAVLAASPSGGMYGLNDGHVLLLFGFVDFIAVPAAGLREWFRMGPSVG